MSARKKAATRGGACDGSGLKLIYTEGSGSIDIGRCPTVVTTPRTTTKPGSGGALSKCNADAPQQQVVSVCN